MNVPLRLVAIIATTVVAAVATRYLNTHQPTMAPLVVPVAVTGWTLFTVYHGYLVIRRLRWRRRRALEAEQVRQLGISADVAPPAMFPGVDVIDSAEHATLPAVPDRQGAMYARGVTVAVMPSVAVLIAALQTTTTGGLATGLAIANVAVMLALLTWVWRSRNPSQPWVQARTRAELLRREQYLCLAAVGPYQNIPPSEVTDTAGHRINTIAAAADQNLTRLIAMRADHNQTRWHDQLWAEPNPPLPDLHQRVRSYLHYRIDKQILWFTRNHNLNRGAERHIAAAVKTALVAALAATVVQTALHILATPRTGPAATGADLLTLVLPPTCAFLLAIQELYSHRRLAASYNHTLDQLADEKTALTKLVATLDNQPSADPATASRQFQATVLHTEYTLTDELHRWRMLIQRDEYDLSL